jgi:hypothetical protein
MGETVTNFDLSIVMEADHVRVTVAGQPSIDQMLSLIHLLGVDSGGWEHDVLAVDLRQVQTPFSTQEQFQLGQQAAASLAHMRRVASIVPPERVTRVSERAAQRDGTNVRVFSDESEAMAWLRGR